MGVYESYRGYRGVWGRSFGLAARAGLFRLPAQWFDNSLFLRIGSSHFRRNLAQYVKYRVA